MNKNKKLINKYLRERKEEADRQKFINKMLILMARKENENDNSRTEEFH